MTRSPLLLAVATVLALARCGGTPEPAVLDPANDICALCRMPVSDRHTAAQIVAPRELPLFFDDLGCLAQYLERTSLAPEAVAYVADHLTAAWVPAARAVYTENPGLQTPMGSHLIAHVDHASRDRDPASHGGRPVPGERVLGARAAAAAGSP